MKLFKSTHDYNYEWSLVSAAQWQKYPNENCPHVSHVDVLNRTMDPETGILTTERLITVNQNIPTIIKKVSRIEIYDIDHLLKKLFDRFSVQVQHNMFEKFQLLILKRKH